MASEPRFAKAKKVMKTSGGTCPYVGYIMGQGVPSVPYIYNLSVTTAAWTQWQIPLGCRAMIIKRRTSTNAFRIATEATGATYITINGGDSYQLDEMFGPQSGEILYFQTVTDNDTIEILVWGDGQDCFP